MIKVAAFYRFHKFPHYRLAQAEIMNRLKHLGVKGSVLLAEEGVNGTIAGAEENLAKALAAISEVSRIVLDEIKFSDAVTMPFKRLKVRLKKEIVTIGAVTADPTEKVGTYVDAQDWNQLIADPETIVIDTRNAYEVGIGTFQNALDPHTESFGEFPAWVRQNLHAMKGKKIAMFCTGGIRCEKASSFMLNEGFEQVFHLKGGILKYLESVPQESSLWNGACFVFDERVAVEHGLAISNHSMCFGCLNPVSAEERQKPGYEEGVCCPACADRLSDEQKASNRERQRQFLISQERGHVHLGPK